MISKSMSWNRMLYNQVLMLPLYCVAIFAILVIDGPDGITFFSTVVIPLSLGLLSFGITLHCGKANVMILPGNNGGIRDVEGEIVELETQKMLLQNNSEDV